MEDSQVGSGMVGLQGVMLFQEVSASLENVLTYLYLEPLWSVHVCVLEPLWSVHICVLEPLWSMHLLICTCSSFEVYNYLLEVSYSTDQIIRLMFRFFSDCETST